MKIISKHKDYFDYLVSYYGYDDYIVWDRRNDKPLNFKYQERFLFFICGEIYPVIRKANEFIHDPNDDRLTNDSRTNFARSWMLKFKGKKTKVNAELRQPVLCKIEFAGEYDYFIPCLGDFGFAGVIEAHEMYEKVYAFLSWLKDNPEIPNNQTDKEKVVSHGFDTKTSFRPLMKQSK